MDKNPQKSQLNNVSFYLTNLFFVLYHLSENYVVLRYIGVLKDNLIKQNTIKILSQSIWTAGLIAQLTYEINKLTLSFKKFPIKYKSFNRECDLKQKLGLGLTP